MKRKPVKAQPKPNLLKSMYFPPNILPVLKLGMKNRNEVAAAIELSPN